MKRPLASSLKGELTDFLRYKRALGFRYERSEGTVRNFDRYVCQVEPPSLPRLDWRTLIRDWLARSRGRKPRTVAAELQLIRQFCLFRRRRDPGAFVPDREWAQEATDTPFLPHFFSVTEIRKMLQHLARRPASTFQRRSQRLLLLVLYCTGLRFGEAARLRLDDLDLGRRQLWVRESKGRSRWVPFGSDLAGEFRRYLGSRRRVQPAEREALLVSFQGKAYSTQLISHTVRQWLRLIGLKPLTGRVGPRPYDLRHSFAVERLRRWYRRGGEVAGRLPWLSVYMGHANILGTETYLNATPELLALTARRFEARFRRRSNGR
jgi:integrase/recombinase XerD